MNFMFSITIFHRMFEILQWITIAEGFFYRYTYMVKYIERYGLLYKHLMFPLPHYVFSQLTKYFYFSTRIPLFHSRCFDSFLLHTQRIYASVNYSSQVQIMAFRLAGATPSSVPLLPYCPLDPKEHISMKLNLKCKSFQVRKCTCEWCLRHIGHFSRPQSVNTGCADLIIRMQFYLKHTRTSYQYCSE